MTIVAPATVQTRFHSRPLVLKLLRAVSLAASVQSLLHRTGLQNEARRSTKTDITPLPHMLQVFYYILVQLTLLSGSFAKGR